MRTPGNRILISGAGPAGLMMACQLFRYSIPFRIIDKSNESSDFSGALLIHAASLEIFKKLGLADELIHQGRILKAINLMFDGTLVKRIDTSNYGSHISEYPFALLVEQSRTEAALNRYLNRHGLLVERNVTLKGFTEYSDRVESLVVMADGSEETVVSDFLIAADGGHSFIRSRLEIPLVGETHSRALFAMDCHAVSIIPDDEVLIAFSPAATTGFFPLGDSMWRIDGAFRLQNPKHEITFDDIHNNFGNITRVNTTVSRPRWFSMFQSHRRYAALFNTDRCFLIGDSAHLYSPVGSQGMNHGLQDAHNLAWKLAYVLRNEARPCILDTYDPERKQVSLRTAWISDLLFDFLSTDRSIYKFLRLYALPVLLKFTGSLFRRPFIKKFLFRNISGVGITYRKSLLNFKSERFGFSGPVPGERIAYVVYSHQGNTESITELKGNRFHLLVFVKDNSPEPGELLGKFSRQVDIRYFTLHAGTKLLYRKFGIRRTTYFLVRPDLYIACKGHTRQYLENYLQKILIPERKQNRIG